MRHEPVLAIWLHEDPRNVLDVLREAAPHHVLRVLPGYGAICDKIRTGGRRVAPGLAAG